MEDVIFEATPEGAVASWSGVPGTTRAIGTPITTTYTVRKTPTKPRPYCTNSLKSPPAPLLPQHALRTLRMTHWRTSTFYLRSERDFFLAPQASERNPDFWTRCISASVTKSDASYLLILRGNRTSGRYKRDRTRSVSWAGPLTRRSTRAAGAPAARRGQLVGLHDQRVLEPPEVDGRCNDRAVVGGGLRCFDLGDRPMTSPFG
jgi:hypothetical protein